MRTQNWEHTCTCNIHAKVSSNEICPNFPIMLSSLQGQQSATSRMYKSSPHAWPETWAGTQPVLHVFIGVLCERNTPKHVNSTQKGPENTHLSLVSTRRITLQVLPKEPGEHFTSGHPCVCLVNLRGVQAFWCLLMEKCIHIQETPFILIF